MCTNMYMFDSDKRSSTCCDNLIVGRKKRRKSGKKNFKLTKPNSSESLKTIFIITGTILLILLFSSLITEARYLNTINMEYSTMKKNNKLKKDNAHNYRIHRHYTKIEKHNNKTKYGNPRKFERREYDKYRRHATVIIDESNPIKDVVIQTAKGKIRGFQQKFDNVAINTFLGVPYAKRPTGTKRFRPPAPINVPWEGEQPATKPAMTCYYTIDTMFPQFPGAEMWNPPNELDEDCLSVNIWAPAERQDGTVLVWIYGGGFFSGSPSLELYDGRVLAARERVIVVNINYRLGPFGFLYFGRGSAVPGNMGLLDQQLALKWINENIAYFGGDPQRVTLFGESAGGASVSAHLFAPDSRNYFNKLIINSGTILNNWATKSREKIFDISLTLAHRLNCTSKLSFKAGSISTTINAKEITFDDITISKIIDCMSNITASILQHEANVISELLTVPMTFAFVPIDDDEYFFKGNLFEKIRRHDFKKDISVILGSVRDEGTYWLPYYLHKYGFAFNHTISPEDFNNQALISKSEYTRAFDAFLPYFGDSPLVRHALLHAYSHVTFPPDDIYNYKDNNNEYQGSTSILLSRDSLPSTRWRDGVARFLGDYFFTCALIDFADLLADNIFGAVYMYYFTKRSTANPWPKWMGVMHGYEIEYVFGFPIRQPKLYESSAIDEERKFSKKIMEIWSHFARTGEPVDYWPKYNQVTRKSLVLDDKIVEKTTTIDGKEFINNASVFVDVHGRLCRLLDEAQNVIIANDEKRKWLMKKYPIADEFSALRSTGQRLLLWPLSLSVTTIHWIFKYIIYMYR